MRERLKDALRENTADYSDIRLENVATSYIKYGGRGELEDIGTSKTVGGIVRALYKGGWGYAKFNDLSQLDVRVKEACESAHLVGRERSCFAAVEPVEDTRPAILGKDFRTLSLMQKKIVLEEYNDILLNYHPKIQSTGLRYEDKFRSIWFANTEGTYIAVDEPDISGYIGANARCGDIGQTAFMDIGGTSGFQVIEGLHSEMETIAQRAIDLLNAPSVIGGKYTIILNPEFAGSFIHEAFGHLSEADHMQETKEMMALMRLGKRVGSEILNVIDDGTMIGNRGTRYFDHEGVKTQKTYLIRDGLLVGRLHSRESAARLNETPTGNARSVGYHLPPISRMTNTYIDKGTATFDEMIQDVKLGVYAVDNIGGSTSSGSFTFSPAYGFMIRDGKIAELVRDITLKGNAFETMLNIDMLGDQVVFGSGGMCGYNQHFPLPVGMGGPHVRIQNVTVGGKS